MKPRIDIISGYLGSGKTTIILEMLKSMPEGERIAICENEYGEVGIDGDVLKQQDLEVMEINAGCVCCTLSNNLISGIKLLAAKYRPTRIILEPTGLANLADILKILADKDLENIMEIGKPAAVIDGSAMATNYEKFKGYFDSQIATAQVLFINRTSGLSDCDRLYLDRLISDINPNVTIVEEPFDALALWGALDAPSYSTPLAPDLSNSWLKGFQQVSINTGWVGSKERLERFIGYQKKFGDVIRVKGYVLDELGDRFRVDLSGGVWTYQPATEDGQNVLQFIGRNISLNKIKEFFI